MSTHANRSKSWYSHRNKSEMNMAANQPRGETFNPSITTLHPVSAGSDGSSASESRESGEMTGKHLEAPQLGLDENRKRS